VDGENFTSRLSKKEQDYHRVYPPEAFLAQSMGHNFGPTVYFLDEFNRSGATKPEDWKRLGTQPVTHLYGLILLQGHGKLGADGDRRAVDLGTARGRAERHRVVQGAVDVELHACRPG